MGQGGGAAGRQQTSTKILEHLLSFPTALWPALRPARGRWRQIQPSAAQPLARTGAGGLRTVPRGSDSLGVYFSAVRQRQGRGEPRSDQAWAAPKSSLRGRLSLAAFPHPLHGSLSIARPGGILSPGHCGSAASLLLPSGLISVARPLVGIRVRGSYV